MTPPKIGIALCLAFASLAAQRPLLVDSRKNPTPLDSSGDTRSLVVDLDGDGIVDIARSLCGRGTGGTGALWRGVGGGRFVAMPSAVDHVLGAADMDGDGDLDLISSGRLHRNEGGWRLTSLPGPHLAMPCVQGDLDGDGDVDLIAMGRVFLATAPFAFQEVTGRLPPLGGFLAPLLADVDGDGDPDLACLGSEPRLALNDGRGFFFDVTATHLPRLAGWTDIVAADIDADGDLDLVAAAGHAVLLVNDGTGRFTDQSARLLMQSREVQAVAAGDIDGDLDVDIALGKRDDGGILLENRGVPFLQLPDSRWPAPRHPLSALVLADIDGDRDLDFVAAGGVALCAVADLETDIAYNDGRGTFQPGRALALAVPVQNGHAVVGDLDGDGNLDALITEGPGWLLRGDGRGGFASPVSLQLGVAGRPTLGDIDGDGDLDAVLAEGQCLHLLLNPGPGLLAPWRTLCLPIPALSMANAATLADLDGDGDLDCAVATSTARYWVGSPAPDFVCWNDGTGRFTVAGDALPSTLSESYDVRAGDLDGDGDLDLVTGAGIYFNLRPGKFDHSPFPSAAQFALADLDGDGRLDIVRASGCAPCFMCGSPQPSVVSWNEGDGRFTEQTILDRAITCAVAVLDADADGDLDLLFGNKTGRDAHGPDVLLANLGGRRFQSLDAGVAFPHDRDDTLAMGGGDLDHDGDVDVVLFNALAGAPGAIRSRVYLNATRQLVALDSAAPARAYRLRIHGGERGAILLLAAQGARIPTPFGRLGLDPRTTVAFGTYGPPLPGEVIAVDLVMPAEPSLIGTALWWQALVGDAAALGARLTNTLREVGAPH